MDTQKTKEKTYVDIIFFFKSNMTTIIFTETNNMNLGFFSIKIYQ